jgi:hypothetical protein
MKPMLVCGAISAGFVMALAASAYAQPSAPDQKPAITAPKTVQLEKKATAPGHRKTIGLITAVADSLTVTTVEPNLFNDDRKKFSVPEWRADDRVAAQVTSLLQKDFNVKRIAVPVGVFARLEAPGGPSPEFDSEYKRLIRQLVGKEKADLYLTITPGYGRFEGEEIVSGLGIVQSRTLQSKGETTHCLVLYRLFDAQFNMLHSEGAIGKRIFSNGVAAPRVAKSGKQAPARDPRSAAVDFRTKDALLSLLDKDVAATVPKLFAHR